MTDFQIRAGETVTPAPVQDSHCLSNDITRIKNGIGCYTDMLQDAMQALTGLQQQLRIHEGPGGSIPVHRLQEVMDAADVDYLTDELPGALDAFAESLNRLQTVQDIIVTGKLTQKRPVLNGPVSDNVIAFPGGIG